MKFLLGGIVNKSEDHAEKVMKMEKAFEDEYLDFLQSSTGWIKNEYPLATATDGTDALSGTTVCRRDRRKQKWLALRQELRQRIIQLDRFNGRPKKEMPDALSREIIHNLKKGVPSKLFIYKRNKYKVKRSITLDAIGEVGTEDESKVTSSQDCSEDIHQEVDYKLTDNVNILVEEKQYTQNNPFKQGSMKQPNSGALKLRVRQKNQRQVMEKYKNLQEKLDSMERENEMYSGALNQVDKELANDGNGEQRMITDHEKENSDEEKNKFRNRNILLQASNAFKGTSKGLEFKSRLSKYRFKKKQRKTKLLDYILEQSEMDEELEVRSEHGIATEMDEYDDDAKTKNETTRVKNNKQRPKSGNLQAERNVVFNDNAASADVVVEVVDDEVDQELLLDKLGTTLTTSQLIRRIRTLHNILNDIEYERLKLQDDEDTFKDQLSAEAGIYLDNFDIDFLYDAYRHLIERFFCIFSLVFL